MPALGNTQMFTGSTTIPIRPLNLGVVTEGSESSLKIGAMVDVDGFDVVESGLRKSGNFEEVSPNPIPLLFADEAPLKFVSFSLEDGDTRSVVITNKLLYSFDPTTGFAPIYWRKTFSIVSYNGSDANAVLSVAGNETIEETGSYLTVADYLVFEDTTLYPISAITYDSGSNTTIITLVGKPATTPTVFKVLKLFQLGQDADISVAVGRNRLWMVDGTSPFVFRYDGTWLNPTYCRVSSSDGTRTMFGASIVAVFKERLWFGDVQDGSAGSLFAHQRVRWSEVLGWGDSDYIDSMGENYFDLVGSTGRVLQIIGLEELLVVFTSDAIFYGQQTSISTLPYAFVQIQTGGISAVSPRAVCGFLGSVFFVGLDDFYLISLDQGYPVLTKIGSQIANSILPPQFPKQVCAVPDPKSSRIVFAFSTTPDGFYSTLWSWNYRTRGWSRQTGLSVRSITASGFADQTRIDELPNSITFNTEPFGSQSLNSFDTIIGITEVYAFSGTNILLKYNSTKDPPRARFETPDYDFDLVDSDKTFLAFGLKIKEYSEHRTDTMSVALEGSTDGGKTWRSLGTLVFAPGDREDQITFRLTGSAVRFRGTWGVLRGEWQWALVEMSVKVRIRGNEYQRVTNRVSSGV